MVLLTEVSDTGNKEMTEGTIVQETYSCPRRHVNFYYSGMTRLQGRALFSHT